MFASETFISKEIVVTNKDKKVAIFLSDGMPQVWTMFKTIWKKNGPGQAPEDPYRRATFPLRGMREKVCSPVQFNLASGYTCAR